MPFSPKIRSTKRTHLSGRVKDMLNARNPVADPNIDRARARLSNLSDAEILNWCDQAGSGIARALQDFRREQDSASLEEARMGILAVLAAVELLSDRRV